MITSRKKEFNCPVEATLAVIGGRWKSLILWNLCNDTLRFSELKKRMPTITQRMLTNQLRELEQDGVIARKAYAEVPVRVEYSLTARGKSLRPILEALCAWGQKRTKVIPKNLGAKLVKT
jgi:DNA-binding HxlR family transcriptional regulator